MPDPTKPAEASRGQVDRDGVARKDHLEEYDPYIGELVPDDGFAFTLLSCHCSVAGYCEWCN